VALVRTDVSEEHIASIRVARISKLETTLAVLMVEEHCLLGSVMEVSIKYAFWYSIPCSSSSNRCFRECIISIFKAS
jgi:hypothetical protein